MNKFKEGQVVKLLPFEDQPEQLATVIGFDQMDWGLSYIVELSPDFKEDEYDDGIRDVTEDQMEAVK